MTHDLAVVRQLCQETVVMRGGCVVEEGPVARILTPPRHPYTRAVLDSVPRPGRHPRRTRQPDVSR
ncbi:hypothetical protein ACFV2H_13660 [Streptomyces sp. NPDC059629]|uniref:ABC transporter ATP-binding protein n=1 Tax=Streptomyces sp. NPDC059629 TaxID=3346889 RepID=UPI00368A5C42